MNFNHKRSRKKRPRKHFSGLYKALLSTCIGLLLYGLFWISDSLAEIRLPVSHASTELYANQIQDDLRQNAIAGINSAKKSLLLMIYSLTDQGIIASLRHKSEEGVEVKVICDAKASPHISNRLGPRVQVVRRMAPGFMHQKILVVDDSKVWIGSANMTGESLRLYGNLVTFLDSPAIAAYIITKAATLNEYEVGPSFPHREFLLEDQKAELWFFPDDPNGVKRLIELIETAKKTIRVAMFTWTRRDLAQAIVKAKQRGVDTRIVIDHNSGKGSGAHIVKLLKSGGIPVRLSQGSALLHHKFLYIDGEILVNGSANWTKAAFTKNDDCFVVLHKLTEKQRKQMDHLWDVIEWESNEP